VPVSRRLALCRASWDFFVPTSSRHLHLTKKNLSNRFKQTKGAACGCAFCFTEPHGSHGAGGQKSCAGGPNRNNAPSTSGCATIWVVRTLNSRLNWNRKCSLAQGQLVSKVLKTNSRRRRGSTQALNLTRHPFSGPFFPNASLDSQSRLYLRATAADWGSRCEISPGRIAGRQRISFHEKSLLRVHEIKAHWKCIGRRARRREEGVG
jgi:hypothetical protein